jgi:hypothetical protein
MYGNWLMAVNLQIKQLQVMSEAHPKIVSLLIYYCPAGN